MESLAQRALGVREDSRQPSSISRSCFSSSGPAPTEETFNPGATASRAFHGVIEVELSSKPKIRRQVVPAAVKLRPSARIPESTARLAVSDQFMVLASELGNITWRRSESGGTVHYTHKPIAIAEDIDVWRDRMILLGLP